MSYFLTFRFGFLLRRSCQFSCILFRYANFFHQPVWLSRYKSFYTFRVCFSVRSTFRTPWSAFQLLQTILQSKVIYFFSYSTNQRHFIKSMFAISFAIDTISFDIFYSKITVAFHFGYSVLFETELVIYVKKNLPVTSALMAPFKC